MSFLGKLFGKKDNATASSSSMAPVAAPVGGGANGSAKGGDIFGKIQLLEERKRLNDKRIEELDRLIVADTEEAKKHLAKNDKSRAMVVLKRKKLRETERENKLNFMVTLETQISELQQAYGQIEDVRSQQAFADGMKDMQRAMDPEKVITLQEEVEDARDKVREVQDVLYGNAMSEHDAELMAELDQLGEEVQAEKVANMGIPGAVAQPLPKVAAPAAAASDVDEELAALQREMGLLA